MKERPILFSAPMVRAILAGDKTQTRRVVKGLPVNIVPFIGADNNPTFEYGFCATHERVINHHIKCPYGQPGDQLWVRENFWGPRKDCKYESKAQTWIGYPADEKCNTPDFWKSWGFKLFPSIHMPRKKSRILLEITAIRVERLQDISENDAVAEGFKDTHIPPKHGPVDMGDGWSMESMGCYASAAGMFQILWHEINGSDSWDENPWVWVIEFKRVKP